MFISPALEPSAQFSLPGAFKMDILNQLGLFRNSTVYNKYKEIKALFVVRTICEN